MPRELKNREEFEKLLPSATEIRIVGADEGQVKVKIRTKDYLYTFKTTEEEAEALTKGAKVDIIEY